MPRFQIKRYEQILTNMIAKIVARTDLSDISDSSVVKHILAAAARQDDEQYYQMSLLQNLFSIDKAVGDDLDERAKDIQPGTITRNVATKATGNIVFSRTGTIGTVNIASGTKVKTASGVVFSTTAAGQITAASPEQIAGHGVGRDSGLVPAIADEPGANGNVVANTIIKFVQKPTGVDEVTNPSAFAYGADEETDDAFRTRIKDYIASLPRSTINALESGVLGAEDEDTGAVILYSKAIEDTVDRGIVTVYIDDGTGSAESYEAVSGEVLTEGLAPGDVAVGGETVLYLNYKPIRSDSAITITSDVRGVLTGDFEYDAGNDYWVNSASGQVNFATGLTAGEQLTVDYTRYTGLIELAQKIIDGDPNDRTTYPGIRAAGVLVYVRVPQVLVQDVSVSLTILEGYEDATVEADVETAIQAYIASLGISGDILISELVKRIMSVAGVYNVYITEPANDITLLDDQLPRVGTITIS
jgi:uncharacterized phage protein gp47/JayE